MPQREPIELRWHRTTLDGRVAVYGDAGEGVPLVFLHGWGLTARTYARTLPAMARGGARVIAPALPGFGKSDALPGAYTFEKLARWIDNLLEHIGIDEPIFLVGHSFGGAVATAVASHRPERTRGLVLVNAVGGQVWKQGRRGERLMADRPLWDWGRTFPTEWARRDYRRVFPGVARDFLTNAVTNGSALIRAAHLARTADLRGELAQLSAAGLPVSILWGDQDTVVPEATFVSLCEAAGSPGDIIDRAGHSWLLADPEGFGEVMTNSLAIHALLNQRDRRRRERGVATTRPTLPDVPAAGPAA